MNTPDKVISFFTTALNNQSEPNRVKILKAVVGKFCVDCGGRHEDTERGRCQCSNDE